MHQDRHRPFIFDKPSNAMRSCLFVSRLARVVSVGRQHQQQLRHYQQPKQPQPQRRRSIGITSQRALSAQAAVAKSDDNNNNNGGDAEAEVTFVSPKVENLYFRMKELPVQEIHQIGDLVMERLGMDPDDDDEFGGAAQDGGNNTNNDNDDASSKEEAKTKFDLRLVQFDAKAKIKVIKEVRAIGGLGLKEAKEMVEGAPKVVKQDLSQEEAEELKTKLEQVGATVEIV